MHVSSFNPVVVSGACDLLRPDLATHNWGIEARLKAGARGRLEATSAAVVVAGEGRETKREKFS